MVSIVMTLDIFTVTIRFNFDIYLWYLCITKVAPWVASDKNELILISEARRGSKWNIERLHLSSKHYRSSFICKLAILNWQRLAQKVQQIRVTMEDKTSTLHKATISLCFSLIYIITNNKKNSDFQINKHLLLICLIN